MIKMVKKDVGKDKISYYYQPDGEGEPGVVSYYPKEKRKVVEKLCGGYNYSMDRNHAFMALEVFVQRNEYPNEYQVNWY